MSDEKKSVTIELDSDTIRMLEKIRAEWILRKPITLEMVLRNIIEQAVVGVLRPDSNQHDGLEVAFGRISRGSDD